MSGPELAAIASLDALRSAVLRRTGRRLAPLFRDRDGRMVASFAVFACVSVGLILVAPAVPLFVLPLVFGLPHVVADVRYLVVRRGLLARTGVVVAVVLPCIATIVLSPVEAASIALVGAAAVARGTWQRRAFVAATAATFLLAHERYGAYADAAFAHGHHLVAVVVFGLIAERRATTIPRLLTIAAIATAVLIYFFDPRTLAILGSNDALAPLASTLAPGATMRGASVVLAIYALHQSLHYAIVLRLVPDAVSATSAPRSFRASHRSLENELGRATLGLVVLTMLGFFVYAAFASFAASRDVYMFLALFHGPLEVALLGLAFAEARRP